MMNIKSINDWHPNFQGVERFMIFGPCSAESKKQVLESCQIAADNGAHLLRAGIWKPRTRPDSFEGVGRIGLDWLKRAGQATGLPVCVEVATPHHVRLAVEHGIDVLWIGARTTVNPFAVQDLAEELKTIDLPVFVKNPVNPDLELWIGAIERIHRAGINRIAAIHRGFSVFNSGPYRNAPMWEIPIELKRRYPQIDVLCDPSHICGKRPLIGDTAQRALDLDFQGLMVECHVDPDIAKSDALQQLDAVQLNQMLEALVERHASVTSADFIASLENLRVRIDNLDTKIIELLAERMKIVRDIGKYKKENGVTILQMNRWSEIFDDRVQNTRDVGLSEEFAQDFIQAVHNESISQQNKIMNEANIDKTQSVD